jgi:hypothetical protein
MTRDEQIHRLAQAIKQEARIVALRRLAIESAAAFERADANLVHELRSLIDDKRGD